MITIQKQKLLVFTILSTLFLLSCTSTQHAYLGPKLPTDQLAHLWFPRTEVVKVDGNPVGSMASMPSDAYVIPGNRKLDISYTTAGGTAIGTMLSTYTFTLRATFEAGQVYYLHESGQGNKVTVQIRKLDPQFVIPGLPFIDDRKYKKQIEEAKTLGDPIPVYGSGN